jgi:Rieske 2Fe-2S family protein
MRTVRVLPLGPEQTEIEVEWLFTPEALAHDEFDHSNITDFAKRVMQQDADASELNQSGMHSRKFQQGVLMPEEYNVKAFQDWVRAQLGEDETAPG